MRNAVMSLVAVAAVLAPAAASAADLPRMLLPEWSYRATAVDSSDEVAARITDTLFIGREAPPVQWMPANPIGTAAVQTVFTPAASVEAFAAVFYDNTRTTAYSELFYEWRAYSSVAIDPTLVNPGVRIEGVVSLSNNVSNGRAFAAINTAPRFATALGEEVGDDASDTDPGTYREYSRTCSFLVTDEHLCGTDSFAMRGMYSQLDEVTIGGFIYLRATANAWAQSGGDEGYIGFKSTRAFIDPVISFDAAFLAAHPDLRLTLSEGITNGAAALAPVPEPATWAMMVAGFALAGAAMRRGRGQGARAIA